MNDYILYTQTRWSSHTEHLHFALWLLSTSPISYTLPHNTSAHGGGTITTAVCWSRRPCRHSSPVHWQLLASVAAASVLPDPQLETVFPRTFVVRAPGSSSFKHSLKSWLFEWAYGRRRVWDTFVSRRALQIYILLLLLLLLLLP